MTDDVYVLDSNVFIEASRRYYAFDIVPKFWEILVEYASNGRILSIDRIRKELGRGKDDLAAWVEKDFRNAFASTDDKASMKAFKDITRCAVSQQGFLFCRLQRELLPMKRMAGWSHIRRSRAIAS